MIVALIMYAMYAPKWSRLTNTPNWYGRSFYVDIAPTVRPFSCQAKRIDEEAGRNLPRWTRLLCFHHVATMLSFRSSTFLKLHRRSIFPSDHRPLRRVGQMPMRRCCPVGSPPNAFLLVGDACNARKVMEKALNGHEQSSRTLITNVACFCGRGKQKPWPRRGSTHWGGIPSSCSVRVLSRTSGSMNL